MQTATFGDTLKFLHGKIVERVLSLDVLEFFKNTFCVVLGG